MVLTHSLLLEERLYLFSRLRFFAAAGILIGGVFATYVVGIRGLDLRALAGTAAFLAAYNILIFLGVRPHGSVQRAAGEESGRGGLTCFASGSGDEKAGYRRLTCIAHVSILLDYLVLTYAIWLVGGAQSPFLAFYLLHAILASVLLSRRAAYGHAAVGYLLLAGLVLGEWSGFIPIHRPIGAVPSAASLGFRVVLTMLFVYSLLTAVTTVLTTGIVHLLRENEEGLREASQHLERLADMRRSFLHVVLHDVRSPVGTVVAMLEGLGGGIDGELSPPQKHRVERAEDRLRGVLEMLRSLRVLADLETERLEALMAPVDLTATIRAEVDDHLDSAEARGQSLRAALSGGVPPVLGVERLLREAIANYLTNAIKYTDQGGNICVRVRAVAAGVRIEVSDDGPGIAAEDQGRLFQEFSRVGKASARQGKPGGIGLGLSIVRRIAEAHGGRAGVVSELGKGSTFFLELPAAAPVR